ncbi:MAG TPA: hypothetical protein PK514_03055 [Spirochaetota bacterium]|nr:hypothetical protein [Spirochaetota bacterium]
MASDQKMDILQTKKPAVIKVFGILNIILGLFGLTVSISIASMAAHLTDKTAGITVAVMGLSVAIPMIAGGIGLLMNKNAGRILSLAASYIALAAGIIYIGIVITALYYIYDQLAGPQRLKFIMRIVTVLCICIYPALNLFFMHSGRVRAAMK